jgi:hypothetical protein
MFNKAYDEGYELGLRGNNSLPNPYVLNTMDWIEFNSGRKRGLDVFRSVTLTMKELEEELNA